MVDNVRGEGPRDVVKFCCRTGGGLEGGVARGESDLAGVGIRGPDLVFCSVSGVARVFCTVSGVPGSVLPVLVTLSALCMESVVVWRRLVGVGLGVPRILGSGLALLGGRGSDIRELSTNQMLVLICVNHSEASIVLYQPIRC